MYNDCICTPICIQPVKQSTPVTASIADDDKLEARAIDSLLIRQSEKEILNKKNKERTYTQNESKIQTLRSRNQIAQLQNPQKKQHLTRIHKLEKKSQKESRFKKTQQQQEHELSI